MGIDSIDGTNRPTPPYNGPQSHSGKVNEGIKPAFQVKDSISLSTASKNKKIISFDKIDTEKVWNGMKVEEGGKTIYGNEINLKRYISSNDADDHFIEEKVSDHSNSNQFFIYGPQGESVKS